MKAFFAEESGGHDPQTFMRLGQMGTAEEVPERAERLLAGAQAAGLEVLRPTEDGLPEIAAVHTPEYLRFLETIHDRWRQIPGAAPEVIPNLHLDRTLGGYPESPVGLATYHQADAACPIGAGTWDGALWSARAAISATRAVIADGRPVYALSRPPGHHAYADMAGGFCFLNNSAIAAEMLVREGGRRVAILDVDVHHGNGTQGIFYGRGDVLTVSLHADPRHYYPYVCGYAHERGAGDGLGRNRNLALPLTTEDDDYAVALADAVGTVRAFRPDALIVALGLDAHADDPLKGMRLSTAGFERIGRTIGTLGLMSIIVQEGGYLCDALGGNLTAFLTGFQAGYEEAAHAGA